MHYMLLVNVFEYFDRENLEKLSIVSRLFKKIVRTEFSKHPFRVFNKLCIVTDRYGDIRLGMENYGIKFNPTPQANVALFKGLIESDDYYRYSDDMKYFSLSEMLPFMGKSVRFEMTIIELNGTLIKRQCITAMEKFANLWNGRTLELKYGNDDEDDSDSDSYLAYWKDKVTIPRCEYILNAPGIITPCRKLQLYETNEPLSVYPVLYALKIIQIKEKHELSAKNLLNFVEGLSKYNSSTTLIICFSTITFKKCHIEKIREVKI
ncbi:hypothetical protein Ddc_23223 [Ditylenchus destructor]|nr:hypothetical protein Ddc_23223 [Ditylenchus destructor]